MAKDGYPEGNGAATEGKEPPFSFEALNEKCSKCAATIKETNKVNTDEYLAVVKEIRKVFDHFGSVFSMAFSDIDTKVETIAKRKELCEGSTEDMFKIMDWEKEYSAEKQKKITADEKKQCSATRAINRMCHVVEMIYVLFGNMKDDPKLEVSKGLKKCYPDTLAKIHGWTVKTAVGMAFSACPTRVKFIETLGSTEDEIAKHVPDIVSNMKEIDAHIQKRFTDFGVEWNFS